MKMKSLDETQIEETGIWNGEILHSFSQYFLHNNLSMRP
jgi:hypothetical protein